ncbi:MAG TPA: 2'-deoxycytidine 5'-triphosphate deaminase [Rhizomicrobium sp.]|nr:2'-deoxycytidine 5'-triphosphate deaminase [Rhizomicrobium sp.]
MSAWTTFTARRSGADHTDRSAGFSLEGRAQGSKAVLEVRSFGVSFLLEHGQTVGRLSYSRLAGGAPSKLYGAQIQSNYQGQGVKLAKHFKPWPSN